MADSTQAADERNSGITETKSIESSTKYPFDRLEKAIKEGFLTMTNSMNHISQRVVQTVEQGHVNRTLKGNETMAYLAQFLEQVMQLAQED
ncbi:hypothetical protein Pyn_27138 [Prunus yedoensis var. nudiflora]|uniref:Uncharacterized protein n=1 Tax=Prunus yedoensis var. nudiflora TaxID=2094558 RepID=A0A314YJZ0_PRUYE|nr:hypothetical protein Pyn_27138 [Prunus yedoensis var. nudiflora]